MIEFRFTEYFEKEGVRKRPYLKREWCIAVVRNPVRIERQEDNRYRFGPWFLTSAGVIFELSPSTIRSQFTMPFVIGDFRP